MGLGRFSRGGPNGQPGWLDCAADESENAAGDLPRPNGGQAAPDGVLPGPRDPANYPGLECRGRGQPRYYFDFGRLDSPSDTNPDGNLAHLPREKHDGASIDLRGVGFTRGRSSGEHGQSFPGTGGDGRVNDSFRITLHLPGNSSSEFRTGLTGAAPIPGQNH